ncbi:hypothetical protein JCM5350_006531 [Sporobolomyces pararoseus]
MATSETTPTAGECVVWFLHARVCGKNSKPFHFPLFNSQELEAAFRVSDRPKPASLTEKQWKDFRAALRVVQEYLTSLDEGGGTVDVDHEFENQIFIFRGQVLDNAVRSGYLRGHEEATTHEVSRQINKDPLSFLAWQEFATVPNFDTFRREPWFDKFQHLVVLHFAFTTLNARDYCRNQDALEPYIKYTWERWKTFTETVVRPQNAEVANTFLRNWASHRFVMVPDSQEILRAEEGAGKG